MTLVTFILRVVYLLWFAVLQESLVSETFTLHFSNICMYVISVGLIMFFINYKHTKLIVENVCFQRCNCVAFYVGLISGLGLFLVASFQVNIND